MFKFKVKSNMNSVLDKDMVESFMPLENEYLHHGLLNLGNKETKRVQEKSIVQ